MSLDDDAREFGQHCKQGGWRLGLLVARNVHVSGDERGRSDLEADKLGRVTANQFADKAGVSARTVQLYYKAWQLAAKAGHCTPAEQLSPRLEDGIINFDDAEEYDAERDQWCRYYRAAKKPHEPKATGDKADSVSQQTETKDKANRAVDALVDTSEKLAKNLCKVVEGVGPKLTGDQSELAAFVERLRETRSALDQQCKEIDQILERIGFGDREEKAA